MLGTHAGKFRAIFQGLFGKLKSLQISGNAFCSERNSSFKAQKELCKILQNIPYFWGS